MNTTIYLSQPIQSSELTAFDVAVAMLKTEISYAIHNGGGSTRSIVGCVVPGVRITGVSFSADTEELIFKILDVLSTTLERQDVVVAIGSTLFSFRPTYLIGDRKKPKPVDASQFFFGPLWKAKTNKRQRR